MWSFTLKSLFGLYCSLFEGLTHLGCVSTRAKSTGTKSQFVVMTWLDEYLTGLRRVCCCRCPPGNSNGEGFSALSASSTPMRMHLCSVADLTVGSKPDWVAQRYTLLEIVIFGCVKVSVLYDLSGVAVKSTTNRGRNKAVVRDDTKSTNEVHP